MKKITSLTQKLFITATLALILSSCNGRYELSGDSSMFMLDTKSGDLYYRVKNNSTYGPEYKWELLTRK